MEQAINPSCVVKEFVNSEAFRNYAEEFYGPFTCALNSMNGQLDMNLHGIDDLAKVKLQHLQKFCQFFWEELPDESWIRHGAFWAICDFAAEYLDLGEKSDGIYGSSSAS